MTEAARRILPLIDLTSLNEDDDAAAIERLCAAAVTPHGNVAAVCLYPRFVTQARRLLGGSGVRVATVANFPHGDPDPPAAAAETAAAAGAGADEVDVVMPYQAWLAGDRSAACRLIEACKTACRKHALLKVILETAALGAPETVTAATRDAIAAGADFVKTSTGKGPGGATLQAAQAMLKEIRENGGTVGFKAAGGIRTVDQALGYLTLADDILGPGWAAPEHFRFGASGLLGDVLGQLGAAAQHEPKGAY